MPLKYDYRDGYWSFENDEVIVHVDQATYQRHITEQMEKRGLLTESDLHLCNYQPMVMQRRVAIAKELRDPTYWLSVTDANVRIYSKRRALESLGKASPKNNA